MRRLLLLAVALLCPGLAWADMYGPTTITPNLTITRPGAASTSILKMNGALFTGGTGTTTAPLAYFDQGSVEPTSWSTSGTLVGLNAPSGFSGNFIDFHINGGAGIFTVGQTGILSATGVFANTYFYSAGPLTEGAPGTVIASSATIAPVSGIQHVSGTSAIATITPPYPMGAGIGGCITLIADGAWTTTTAGNIHATMTAVVGAPYQACYDATSWYIK